MSKAQAVAAPNDKTAEKTEGAESAAPAKSKKKKIIVIAVAAVLVLALGGGAAWWFLKPAKKHAEGKAAEGKGAETEKVVKHPEVKVDPKKPPIFVPLESFTVNLADREYDHFLQIVIQLQVKDDKVGNLLKVYDPALRHRFLFLMSTATSEMLKSPEGKQALAQQLTLVANEVLAGAPGTEEGPAVLGTSFTTFVIQ